MPIHEARKIIRNVYTSTSWASKVDKMSDNQIQAIYIRFKAEGKL